MKLRSILLLASILLTRSFIPLIGMTLSEMPAAPTVIFSPEYNIVDTIKDLLTDNLTPEDELFILAPHFTETNLAKLLANASCKGTNIQVIIDHTSSQQNHNKAFEVSSILQNHGKIHVHSFNTAGVKQYNQPIQMHIKALIWAHRENDITSYRVFAGSANLSEAAKVNQEHLILYPNNETLFNHYRTLVGRILDGAITELSLLDANRPTVNLLGLEHPFVFSTSCNLMKSISNTIGQAENGDEIYISSLSYNDQYDTKEALIAAQQRGAQIQLIIDRNSYSDYDKKIIDQLNKMHEKNINILTLTRENNDNGYANEVKNHCKYILLKKAHERIVIEGSANLTYQSNFDINQLAIHYNNQEFYDAFEQYHKELARSGHCTPYTSIKPQRLRPFQQDWLTNKKKKLN